MQVGEVVMVLNTDGDVSFVGKYAGWADPARSSIPMVCVEHDQDGMDNPIEMAADVVVPYDEKRLNASQAHTDSHQEGAWQCGAGHMFRYEPPPGWPPWCALIDCHAGDFRWIVKDDVNGQDWLI
jgi:hypothetical protein